MKHLSTKRKFAVAIAAIAAIILIAEIVYRVAEHRDAHAIEPALLAELSDYAKSHGMREDVAVIVDFSASSRYNRFYLVNLKDGKMIFKSKCAHGLGGGSTAETPQFSNAPGSKCSSLGHYKVFATGTMKSWHDVPCLRLKGLDATNSNAEARGILIHGGIDVWQYLLRYCQMPLGKVSEGCFAINFPDFFRLRKTFEKSDKPMLLYAYN